MSDLEFLRTKWAFLYGMLDINKDGVLSELDADETKDHYIAHHHLTGGATDAACKRIDDIWNNLVFRNADRKGQSVSSADFVSALSKDYDNNSGKLKESMQTVVQTCIQIADENEDGFISHWELYGVFKGFGVTCEDTSKALFTLIDPKCDDNMHIDRYRSFWSEFLIGLDRNKFEETKKAFAK